MGTEVRAITRKRLILPTADWFYPIRGYERDLAQLGMTLKTMLISTLEITCKVIAGGPNLYAVPTTDEYQNHLTQYLLQLDAKWNERTDPNIVAIAAEVSTHFYQELTALFRAWNMTDFQIRTMAIDGWIANDLIVGVVY